MDDKIELFFDLFVTAVGCLEKNELYHDDTFSLFEKTTEIGNEEFESDDSERNTKLLSPLQRDEAGIVNLEFVTLHAYPYSQTLSTIIYCNDVILSKLYNYSFYNTKNTLTEQCFYAGCLYLFIILSFRSVYLNDQLIKKGNIFFEVYYHIFILYKQEDDYIFLDNIEAKELERKSNEEQIQQYYRQYELITKESEETYKSLLVRINNIRILNTFITMKKIYGDTIRLMINHNNTFNNLKTNAIQQRCVYILSYFNDIKNSIPLCEIVEGSIDPDLCLFVKYQFNKMEIPSYNYEDIYEEWKDMINKYLNAYKLVMSNRNNLFTLHSHIKLFFLESNSILIRSYISILYDEFVEKQFIMTLEDSFHLPDDFFQYENGENFFYSIRNNMNDYFKLYCLTASKHFRDDYSFIIKMSNFVRDLVNWYELLKTKFSTIFAKNEKYYILLLYYLYGVICKCSKDYIEDMFKLKLNEKYETYMLCWFIDYTISRLICYYNKIIELITKIKQEEIELKKQLNIKKSSYRTIGISQDENINHFKNEVLYFEILQLVYRGIFQALLALRIKGILIPLVTVYGNEESRYYKRLGLFKTLEEPGFIEYKDFVDATSPDKVKFEDLIQLSLNTFKTAKNSVSRLLDQKDYIRKDELIHLMKISSGNLVSIMKYVSSSYESKDMELDYSFSQVFPVIRFK